MKIDREVEFLFRAPRAKTWLTRPRLPRANALFPITYEPRIDVPTTDTHLYSLDRRALLLSEKLFEVLSKEFPPDVLPSGFAGATAVPGNFSAMLSVSGYGQDPLPIPIASNDKFVAKSGIVAKMKDEHVPLFKELMRLFFGAARAESLRIRKVASTGLPFFITDNQYKKLSFMKIADSVDTFLDLACG